MTIFPEGFDPTHIVTFCGAEHPVMLDTSADPRGESGPAYTAPEWEHCDKADFSCVDGSWLFQGQPFSGSVTDL